MAHPNRVNHQPVFLLASKPWRENSLWIEVFSRDYGRVALLARSARTRGSELRGVLIPFVPLSASWFGKEELKTLHRAEWLGGWRQPDARRLFSAMYVNELVLKLTAREDPLPEIYALLHQVHQSICTANHHAAMLRIFEWRLLTALGLLPDCRYDENGMALNAEADYFVHPEQLPQKLPETYADFQAAPTLSNGISVRGSTLLQLDKGEFTDSAALQQALALTRMLLDFHLPQGIRSRQVLQQLNVLKSA